MAAPVNTVPTWTAEEQKLLEAALKQFPASAHQPLERYLRIAAKLATKTATDVALRARWTQEGGARKRKAPVAAVSDRSKQARGSSRPGAATSKLAKTTSASTPFVPTTQPVPMDDHGAATVGVVGGPIATLLDSNYAVLNQLKINMQQCRVHENTELLMRYRDNILSILNHMNNMGGVMGQMPPLPVRMNVELANNFLPKPGTSFGPSLGYSQAGWNSGPGTPAGPKSKLPKKTQSKQQPKINQVKQEAKKCAEGAGEGMDAAAVAVKNEPAAAAE